MTAPPLGQASLGPSPSGDSPSGRSPRLLLGTSNPGKAAEFRRLLSPARLELLTLDQCGPGQRSQKPARRWPKSALKATAYARHFRCWTLADDTALCVSALGGSPGLHTARYAGPQATAADNRAKLLAELKMFPAAQAPDTSSASWHWPIQTAPCRLVARGGVTAVFFSSRPAPLALADDSLFELLEYRRTLAQLGPAKQLLSHRARATSKSCPSAGRDLPPTPITTIEPSPFCLVLPFGTGSCRWSRVIASALCRFIRRIVSPGGAN